MFMRKTYDVIVVDDEPDIIQISKLTLKNLSYAGAVLRLHTFGSKIEALEFLQNLPDSRSVAVALVDVIMESDLAGLELCSYIRTYLKNDITQLIIRTGQPGRAPQREVLDAYEVNGYISKAEATQDTLYTHIVGGLRNYEWAMTSLLLYRFFNSLLAGFRSRDELIDNIRQFVQLTEKDPSLVCHSAFFLDDTIVSFGEFTDDGMRDPIFQSLRTIKGRQLSDNGDTYTIEEEQDGPMNLLLSLGEDERLPRVHFLTRLSALPSEFTVTMWLRSLYALRRFLLVNDYVTRLKTRTASMPDIVPGSIRFPNATQAATGMQVAPSTVAEAPSEPKPSRPPPAN